MTKTFVSVLEFALKPRVTFDHLAGRLTDAWLDNANRQVSPDVVYRHVEDLVRSNMLLTVVEPPPMSSLDWRVRFVRRYQIPTSLIAVDRLQEDRSLRDVSDTALAQEHIVGVCLNALEERKTSSGRIDLVARGLRVIGNRMVVPAPSGTASWCIILAEIHSLTAYGLTARFDDVDLAILQLLREGMSARDIGHAIELSHRTVEHRVERMKARAGVRSIVPLLIG